MAYVGPWYGESYRLDGSDSPRWLDWRYHFDGSAAALGDTVVVGAYADSFDPDAFAAYDGPIVARWVIEVAGAGTISVWGGVDPAGSYDDPSLATQFLGTLASNGPGTLVSDPIDVDHATLVAGTPVIAALQGDGITVVQVKLRVWPAAGAGGGWVNGPTWYRTDANVKRWYGAISEGTDQLPTYGEAWGQLKEVVLKWDGRPGWEYSSTSGGAALSSFFYVFDNIGTAPFTPSGSAGAQVTLLIARPDSPRPEPSLNAGFDPGEVWYEERSFIRDVSGGPAFALFNHWNDEAVVEVERPTWVAIKGLGSEPNITPIPESDGLGTGRMYHPVDFSLVEGPSKPIGQVTDSGYVALSVMAAGYFTEPTEDSFTEAGANLPALLPFTTIIAGYQWYSPAAVPAPALAPRFFVKDLDQVMRPVGFGKPASETAVFRVPTAQGMYRDLTTDEYATYGPDSRPPGGYPLRVKRRDTDGADWWDHVGWMVPDAG